MAVFPDRIVLKNSTDDQATIEAAIKAGGTDAIVQGEVVLGLETGSAQLYTRDATGAIVTISGSGSGSGSGECCGGGDGGDFDTGVVDASFVFGVYGGGDFGLGADDNPVELLNGNEGPDAGSF